MTASPDAATLATPEVPASPLTAINATLARVSEAALAGLLAGCSDPVLREEVRRVGPVDVLLGLAASHERWTATRIASKRKSSTGRRTVAISLLPRGPEESAAAFQERSVRTVVAAVAVAVARGIPQRGTEEQRAKGQKARLHALCASAKAPAKLGVDAVLAVKVPDIGPLGEAFRAAAKAANGEPLLAGRTDAGVRKGGRYSLRNPGEEVEFTYLDPRGFTFDKSLLGRVVTLSASVAPATAGEKAVTVPGESGVLVWRPWDTSKAIEVSPPARTAESDPADFEEEEEPIRPHAPLAEQA